jgi:hypothetical protein
MTYTAFSYKVPLEDKEVDTFGLIPNSLECSMNFGFWNTESKELILKSKDKIQELKSYQKMNDFGEGVFDKKEPTRPLIERRMIENNLQFTISNIDEIKDWISGNVSNSKLAFSFIN